MGTIEVERKNGHYIKRCVGINSEGMLDYQLNGDTEVVGAIYIKLSENNRLNLAIKVNRESNFDTLSNVTLSIETSEIDSNRYIELYKESGMESDGLELISCIKSSKKIYEFNISKYFSEPTD